MNSRTKPGNQHFPKSRKRINEISMGHLAQQHLTTHCTKCGGYYTGLFYDTRKWFKTHKCRAQN